jgi:hypothetical protein
MEKLSVHHFVLALIVYVDAIDIEYHRHHNHFSNQILNPLEVK